MGASMEVDDCKQVWNLEVDAVSLGESIPGNGMDHSEHHAPRRSAPTPSSFGSSDVRVLAPDEGVLLAQETLLSPPPRWSGTTPYVSRLRLPGTIAGRRRSAAGDDLRMATPRAASNGRGRTGEDGTIGGEPSRAAGDRKTVNQPQRGMKQESDSRGSSTIMPRDTPPTVCGSSGTPPSSRARHSFSSLMTPKMIDMSPLNHDSVAGGGVEDLKTSSGGRCEPGTVDGAARPVSPSTPSDACDRTSVNTSSTLLTGARRVVPRRRRSPRIPSMSPKRRIPETRRIPSMSPKRERRMSPKDSMPRVIKSLSKHKLHAPGPPPNSLRASLERDEEIGGHESPAGRTPALDRELLALTCLPTVLNVTPALDRELLAHTGGAKEHPCEKRARYVPSRYLENKDAATLRRRLTERLKNSQAQGSYTEQYCEKRDFQRKQAQQVQKRSVGGGRPEESSLRTTPSSSRRATQKTPSFLLDERQKPTPQSAPPRTNRSSTNEGATHNNCPTEVTDGATTHVESTSPPLSQHTSKSCTREPSMDHVGADGGGCRVPLLVSGRTVLAEVNHRGEHWYANPSWRGPPRSTTTTTPRLADDLFSFFPPKETSLPGDTCSRSSSALRDRSRSRSKEGRRFSVSFSDEIPDTTSEGVAARGEARRKSCDSLHCKSERRSVVLPDSIFPEELSGGLKKMSCDAHETETTPLKSSNTFASSPSWASPVDLRPQGELESIGTTTTPPAEAPERFDFRAARRRALREMDFTEDHPQHFRIGSAADYEQTTPQTNPNQKVEHFRIGSEAGDFSGEDGGAEHFQIGGDTDDEEDDRSPSRLDRSPVWRFRTPAVSRVESVSGHKLPSFGDNNMSPRQKTLLDEREVRAR